MCIKDHESIKAPKQANKPTEEQHQLELNNHCTKYKVTLKNRDQVGATRSEAM